MLKWAMRIVAVGGATWEMQKSECRTQNEGKGPVGLHAAFFSSFCIQHSSFSISL
jgi:hypothetical protein